MCMPENRKMLQATVWRTSYLISILFLFLSMFSCQTAQELPVVPQEPITITYNTDKNVVIDGKTFLFVRTYDPHYNNPICIENILKGLINLAEVNDTVASHVALGFSLEDDFWGLTINEGDGINRNLTPEHCTDTSNNPYMRKCDMEKSWQTTYALTVTKDEFDTARKITERYVNDPEMRYTVGANLKIAGFELKRRFFTPKEKRNIKTLEPQESPPPNHDEKEFQCASFVTYILINSVENVRKFFEDRGVDYKQKTPSDITQIPGVMELFSSTWTDYHNASEQFIAEKADIYIERALKQQVDFTIEDF